MSEFLDNLKNAVEKGNFNSEAAKKINEIDKLADEKKGSTPQLNYIADKIDDGTIKLKKGTEEEIESAMTEYEEKMEKFKKQDLILNQIAALQNMSFMIQMSIQDMNEFIRTLEEKFDVSDDENKALFDEINAMKKKYKTGD